jgi:DNA-binding GntR family transcriptional regulator
MGLDESLSEKAYRILKEEIITCQFSPGNRIGLSTLSRQMGIGLTPIRDALQRLGLEGFVEVIPRHGYIVTSIDIAYVGEIFEMRKILEQAVASIAAERGSNDDLESIREIADFQYKYKARDTYLGFLDRNTNFHLAIAEATENSRLVDTLSKLLVEMTRVFHLGLDLRDSANEMRMEHIELADALIVRDSTRAVELVGRQIETSKCRILEALDKNNRSRKKALIRGISRSHILFNKKNEEETKLSRK